MIDAGYFAKMIVQKPESLSVQGVREICSVSTCISPAPDGWVDQWRHNEFGWFNTITDAWSVVPELERPRYRLFAYRIGLTRFRKGEPLSVSVPADVHPAPIPAGFASFGYDAVSRYGLDTRIRVFAAVVQRYGLSTVVRVKASPDLP